MEKTQDEAVASRRIAQTEEPSKKGRPNRPPWLKLKEQTELERNYEIILSRAAAVLWMFRASANGLIDSKIAEMLPKYFQPWSKKWEAKEIGEILKNRAVIGENQRYKIINGKRRPVGKPVENAFPRIVPPELFDRVQKARTLPRTGNLANLFATVANCECCEQPMKYRTEKERKAGRPKSVLLCNNKICPAYRVKWPYFDFERVFNSFADQIDDADMIKEQRLDDAVTVELEIKILREERAAKQAEIVRLERRIDEIDREVEKLGREKENKLSLVGADHQPATRDDDYRLRSRKAARIKEAVRELYLAAAGTKPRLAERIELIKKKVKTKPAITKELIEGIEELKNTPFVLATFEAGRQVAGIPNKDHPDDIELCESIVVEEKSGKTPMTKDILPPVKLLMRFTFPLDQPLELRVANSDETPGRSNGL